MSEMLQLPQTVQVKTTTWYADNVLPSNVLHLMSGSFPTGNGVSLSALQGYEISASWYTPGTVSYVSGPINDETTANQLDIEAQLQQFEYNSGTGSDPSITVTGYYIQGPSSFLVGYATLTTPRTMALPYDGFDVQPVVPFPPTAQ